MIPIVIVEGDDPKQLLTPENWWMLKHLYGNNIPSGAGTEETNRKLDEMRSYNEMRDWLR